MAVFSGRIGNEQYKKAVVALLVRSALASVLLGAIVLAYFFAGIGLFMLFIHDHVTTAASAIALLWGVLAMVLALLALPYFVTAPLFVGLNNVTGDTLTMLLVTN